MTKYAHQNGDTIEVTGQSEFVVTRSGVQQKVNIARWSKDAKQWIENDIRAGYYAGFALVADSVLLDK